jgi:hypothetical protein
VRHAVLERFEEKHHVFLPIAFKEYLLTVNGMKEGQTDENLISVLPLQAMDREANYKEISANWVEMIIAEFCIYSHLYVLRTSRSGDRCAVFATDGKHEKQLASSFEDFVRLYLSSPARMAHCWL